MAFGRMIRVIRQCAKISTNKMFPLRTLFPQIMTVRGSKMSPNDISWSNKLKDHLGFYSHWEKLRMATAAAMSIMLGSIGWALYNKVDKVHQNHVQTRVKMSNIKDIPAPKLVLINQKYKPWPELQAVLDRMKQEEYKCAEKVSPTH